MVDLVDACQKRRRLVLYNRRTTPRNGAAETYIRNQDRVYGNVPSRGIPQMPWSCFDPRAWRRIGRGEWSRSAETTEVFLRQCPEVGTIAEAGHVMIK